MERIFERCGGLEKLLGGRTRVWIKVNAIDCRPEQKATLRDGVSPRRYDASPVFIYGELLLCSEWFEVLAKDDRPFLLKWLAL